MYGASKEKSEVDSDNRQDGAGEPGRDRQFAPWGHGKNIFYNEEFDPGSG